MAMQRFRRRFYHHPSDLLHDARAIIRGRRQSKGSKSGMVIDVAFRERLMLAVTEVNGCRYCAYAHAKMALTAGLTESDITALAEGDLRGSPPGQIPALLYAQHWAETDADPDPEVRRRVLETYGRSMTDSIELSLSMIRVGNLLGNTWDYLIYRASCGRWGNAKN